MFSTSFIPDPELRPATYRSPSPPRRFWEPLSPIQSTFPYPSSQGAPALEPNSRRRALNDDTESDDEYEARSIPTKEERQSVSHIEGIDTLASIALGTSPTFSASSHFAPRNETPTHHSLVQPYKPDDRSDHALSVSHGAARPSKRARSEAYQAYPLPMFNYGMASRPATSYSTYTGWGYNVEQIVDKASAALVPRTNLHNGFTRHAPKASHDEAELLLFFSVGATQPRPSESVRGASQLESQPNTTLREFTIPTPSAGADLYTNNFLMHTVETTGQMPSPSDAFHARPALRADPAATQTQTPPEEGMDAATTDSAQDLLVGKLSAESKPRVRLGWPDGKSNGPKRRKRDASQIQGPAAVPFTGEQSGLVESAIARKELNQLHSPQSLPSIEPHHASDAEGDEVNPTTEEVAASIVRLTSRRRHRSHSFFMENPRPNNTTLRSGSVPVGNGMLIGDYEAPYPKRTNKDKKAQDMTICAGCNLSRTELAGDRENWISCDACKKWYHYSCAGFKSSREVRNVDKYHCKGCRPIHGPTTFVRKSSRPHATVDYATLNEGVLRTSDDAPEHHYISKFKDGSFHFQPDRFPRMRPGLITAEYFERCRAMTEPIVIPAAWNPRPHFPGDQGSGDREANDIMDVDSARTIVQEDDEGHSLDDEIGRVYVTDDGQDKLDMVIPQGLTVRRVAEMYGINERVEVIDVKSQEGEDRRWTMGKWADYYEATGEKVVRNVISLEVSTSMLGRLIRRPKVVRDMDLQDSVWPKEETIKGNYPKVQFYCLMSVADCYTDFHIDFGGSSVYYHIVKGKKTFFFIPPESKHLKKYEEWCLSSAQNWTWLADQTKECYRVDLSEGDTMLIPSGWIHAVWTPEDSLVIGGNFLTRMHLPMQLKIADIEKNTKVARKFRYPHFQKVMWYTLLKYLKDDPLPHAVEQLYLDGGIFERDEPIWLQLNKFGHNSDPGPEYFHARYYAQAEVEGWSELTRYIFRTVLISMGLVEGVTKETKEAVTRSIPKGYGDPLHNIRKFAVWTAWKTGTPIPQWAHPDANLHPEGEVAGEKKLSAAAIKRLERQATDGVRAPGRQSARQRSKAEAAEAAASASPSLGPDILKPTTSPKTSVLGPKRVACDACRKRRIRCKHKEDPLTPSSVRSVRTAISLDTIAGLPSDGVAVVIPAKIAPSADTDSVVRVATKDRAQAKALLDSLQDSHQVNNSLHPQTDLLNTPDLGIDMKRVRNKACVDCRRSKRRCIHDENGNIDSIKAQQPTIPRGSTNNKKRRTSDEAVASPLASKKARKILSTGAEDMLPATKWQGDIAMYDAYASDPIPPGSYESHGTLRDPDLDNLKLKGVEQSLVSTSSIPGVTLGMPAPPQDNQTIAVAHMLDSSVHPPLIEPAVVLGITTKTANNSSAENISDALSTSVDAFTGISRLDGGFSTGTPRDPSIPPNHDHVGAADRCVDVNSEIVKVSIDMEAASKAPKPLEASEQTTVRTKPLEPENDLLAVVTSGDADNDVIMSEPTHRQVLPSTETTEAAPDQLEGRTLHQPLHVPAPRIARSSSFKPDRLPPRINGVLHHGASERFLPAFSYPRPIPEALTPLHSPEHPTLYVSTTAKDSQAMAKGVEAEGHQQPTILGTRTDNLAADETMVSQTQTSVLRQSTRHSKPVERLSDILLDQQDPEHRQQPSTSQTPQLQVNARKASRSRSGEPGKTFSSHGMIPNGASPSSTPSTARAATAPKKKPRARTEQEKTPAMWAEEDEKIARMLQESEFGLRRRSR